MPAMLERTVMVDRSLARRADRKLRHYGHSFDEAVNVVLGIIVAKRGDPLENAESEIPGPRLLASFREAEMMEKGLKQAKAGQGMDLDDAFARISESI